MMKKDEDKNFRSRFLQNSQVEIILKNDLRIISGSESQGLRVKLSKNLDTLE